MSSKDRRQLESANLRIQESLERRPVPEPVERALLAMLDRLPGTELWAVRSSGTAEDLPQASFAGQHESFLNVRREQILPQVRRCWLSLFSSRAISYRVENGVPHDRVAMAVIVQQMVPAEKAGVLFTADPVSRNTNRIVIEGAPGLGERVVRGEVTPERVVLQRYSFEVRERTLMGGPAVMENALLQGLAQLSCRAEQVLSGPLDIEWASLGERVYLLQARPITGQAPTRTWEDRQVWTNLNTGEIAPDVVTPITWSMFNIFLGGLFRSVFRLVGADVSGSPLAGLVAGRIYFNVNTAWAAVRPFAWLLRRTPNLAQAIGGGQVRFFEQGLLDLPEADLPDLGFRPIKFVLSWPGVVRDVIRHSPRKGDAWCARLKAQQLEGFTAGLESKSTLGLAQAFTSMVGDCFRDWDLLFLGTQMPALLVFQKACRDWLKDPDLSLGYRLFAALGGFPEAEAGLALWKLAVLAHADPQTERAILAGSDWDELQRELAASGHGQQFLGAWGCFLAEHGHHCRGELELHNSRWSENPDYILNLVRGYLRAQDGPGPLAKQERLAKEREQLLQECYRRLKNPLKRWIFFRSLRRAQTLARTREEWKNQAVRRLALMRQILLGLGARLQAESRVASAEDVFFLEIAELEPVAAGQADASITARVAQRRRAYQENLTLPPPPSIVVGRYEPDAPPTPAGSNPEELQGIPIFPGTVTGRARVILRWDDQAQVLPGEILIAPFTDPAWTPYFVTAAGVVMDQGGILSHGSIVAREYGLPAVTNVGVATQIARTGDLVKVDGKRGTFTILERAAPA